MNGLDTYALLLLIVAPMSGALILLLIPGSSVRAVRWTASLIALVSMLLSFYVFWAYDHQAGGIQFERTWDWLAMPGPWPLGDRAVTLHLGVDGVAAPMVLLTGIVLFTGVLVSWNIVDRAKEFFVLYLVLLSGVFGVFVTLDMFLFFLFYELAVMPMYLLIGVWGSSSKFPTFSRTKEYGAMKLMLYLVGGSVLVWIAILAIFAEAGLGSFDLVELQQVAFSESFQRVFFPFLMVGFGVLAGLWPFHTWSPDGHVAAPTAVSMVHAGVLMKLGAFGIIRVGMMLMPDGAQDWMVVLVLLGTVNVLYGAWSALGQTDLKYVIGYSSVSHMGYVLMGIATLHPLGLSGAVLQMFSHGVMTALFFAIVGVVYDRTHTRDINVLNGLGRRMGFTATLVRDRWPGIARTAGPQWIRGRAIGLSGPVPDVSASGRAGHCGRGDHGGLHSPAAGQGVYGADLGEQWADQTDAGRLERVSALVLAGFILLVGLFPFPFIRVIESGVFEVLARFPEAG